VAKDGIQGDWSDVEELEPHAKTGMANVQVRVRCTTAVVGQCKQLFGEELENWRGGTIGLVLSQNGITRRTAGGRGHTRACPAMMMITMQE